MKDKVFSFEKSVSRLNRKKSRAFKKLAKKWVQITLVYPFCYPCREMKIDRYSFDDDFNIEDGVLRATAQHDGMVIDVNDKVVVLQKAEKVKIFPLEFVILIELLD